MSHKVCNSHLTALNRKRPSAPMQWLYNNGLLHGTKLDYGCGKGFDGNYYGFDYIYDPFYYSFREWSYDTIDTVTCIYVLNTIPKFEDREWIIYRVQQSLNFNGIAYIAVRNDKQNLNGWTKRGTYQTFVDLKLPVIHKTNNYLIYRMTKYDKI